MGDCVAVDVDVGVEVEEDVDVEVEVEEEVEVGDLVGVDVTVFEGVTDWLSVGLGVRCAVTDGVVL